MLRGPEIEVVRTRLNLLEQRYALMEARMAQIEGRHALPDNLTTQEAARFLGVSYSGFRKLYGRDPELQTAAARFGGPKSPLVWSRSLLQQYKEAHR
jgi:hypothetical protein